MARTIASLFAILLLAMGAALVCLDFLVVGEGELLAAGFGLFVVGALVGLCTTHDDGRLFPKAGDR